DATRLLEAAAAGNPGAAAELLPLVDDERRKLAAARLAEERPGRTPEAPAPVHEAWLSRRLSTWSTAAALSSHTVVQTLLRRVRAQARCPAPSPASCRLPAASSRHQAPACSRVHWSAQRHRARARANSPASGNRRAGSFSRQRNTAACRSAGKSGRC